MVGFVNPILPKFGRGFATVPTRVRPQGDGRQALGNGSFSRRIAVEAFVAAGATQLLRVAAGAGRICRRVAAAPRG